MKLMTLCEALDWCREHEVTLNFCRSRVDGGSWVEASFRDSDGSLVGSRAPQLEEAVAILEEWRTRGSDDKGVEEPLIRGDPTSGRLD